MTEQVEVRQEDRDAAALYVRDNQQPRLELQVRKGLAYKQLSEAFARHAEQARRDAVGELVEKLNEANIELQVLRKAIAISGLSASDRDLF